MSIHGIIYQIIVLLFLINIFSTLLLNRLKIKKTASNFTSSSFAYYFLVPCINEELVIKDTLLHLLQLDINKTIYVIDDGSTDGTSEIADNISHHVRLVKRSHPNAQKGKGEALNAALALVIQEVHEKNIDPANVIVGVVDADGVLSSNIGEELSKVFSETDVCAAQTRVKMKSVNHLMKLSQDAEFFSINNLSQKARGLFATVGLSGNGQFFRLSGILTHLGEKPWGTSLLDDYELTLKMMLFGLKIVYIDQAFVSQEALTDLKKFIRQRSRWVQGNLECLRYVPRVAKSKMLNLEQKIGVFSFLSQPFINMIADIMILLLSYQSIKSIDLRHLAPSYLALVGLVMSLSVLIGLIFTIRYVYDLKKMTCSLPEGKLLCGLPFAISYIYILLFFSLIIAFYRFITGKKSWLKTERTES